ncbi:hypothetical protein M885DRAFT_519752 [Pelagophyceae sp. CCMP2097]|nr:hypothetical protein M885DRAFT_519752 [Pelagophyceae sp. CCMP2097]
MAPSEDEVMEWIETAEESKNIERVLEALVSCCADPSELGTAAEAAADALDRLAADSAAEYDRDAGARAIVAGLTAFQDEAAIVEVLLSCVRRAATDNPSAAAIFAANAAAVIGSMARHQEGESTLQEQGCLAIEAVANAGGAADFNAAGAKDACLRAVDAIFNERNKTYPHKALAALDK